MTCKLCRGLGVTYGNSLTGTVYPVCGGTGMTDNMSTPAEKTLLDEFAVAAMEAIISKSEHSISTTFEAMEKINQTCGGAYSYAAAMMRERARRDEMGNVKEANT